MAEAGWFDIGVLAEPIQLKPRLRPEDIYEAVADLGTQPYLPAAYPEPVCSPSRDHLLRALLDGSTPPVTCRTWVPSDDE